jgi:serine protease
VGRQSAAGVSDNAPASFESNPHYLTLKLIKALRKRSDVALVEPNYRIKAAVVPTDELYPLQWHLDFINLEPAWELIPSVPAATAPIVAVVDSGVLLGHPDLVGKLVDGYDFIRNPDISADGDGIDANPDDVGDREGPSQQSSFHGTHVAGTVGARSNNINGVASVAWSTRIMPVRVLGVGGGDGYDLIQGIRYAAGLGNDSGQLPPQRADIINLSLGCSSCYSQVLQDTLNEARAAGVIVVAAAGNNGGSVPFYPAAYAGVVAVSAVNSGSTIANYSNFGGYIDVAAPGGDEADRDGDGSSDRILSTLGNDASGVIEFAYGWSTGTSMAAPHVAGVLALMKVIYPELAPDDVDQALAIGLLTTDLGAIGRDDQYGHGKINALKAVQAAQDLSGTVPVGVIITNPTVLDFPHPFKVSVLRVSTQGDNAPQVLQVSADQPWLTVIPTNNVSADGTGDYEVKVDRTGLETAVYQGKITLVLSEGENKVVPVNMQVFDEEADLGNPGLLYVLLRDNSTQEISHEARVRIGTDGRFRYSFEQQVTAGSYRIYAGSDIDNDLVICGPGETCGAWPTRERADDLRVDGDIGGLDFDLGTEANFVIEQQAGERAKPETTAPATDVRRGLE